MYVDLDLGQVAIVDQGRVLKVKVNFFKMCFAITVMLGLRSKVEVEIKGHESRSCVKVKGQGQIFGPQRY